MVRQDSVVGDDGSHRLLVVPCVLVVLVLVLMVTACSRAGGADAVRHESVEPDRTDAAGGVIAEPVVTEDGRMIQPEGHTGLWFETEPSDPLEKLVYESQRFVGQPVALEPIGERALLPQWEDMPDPCHPEVLRRMEDLGVEVVDSSAVGAGVVTCGMMTTVNKVGVSFGFELALVEDPGIYSGGPDAELGRNPGVRRIMTGGDQTDMGCVVIIDDFNGGNALVSTSSLSSAFEKCDHSERSLQIGKNLIGGYLER
jgi:hypothetical protein